MCRARMTVVASLTVKIISIDRAKGKETSSSAKEPTAATALSHLGMIHSSTPSLLPDRLTDT